MDCSDNGGHLGEHRGDIRSGRALPLPHVELEGGRVPDEADEVPRGGLGVWGRHDGADNGGAVQGFRRGRALEKDALQVGPVEAADADSLRGVVAGRGDGGQDVAHAGSADDLLRVGLSARPRQQPARPRQQHAPPYVGVA